MKRIIYHDVLAGLSQSDDGDAFCMILYESDRKRPVKSSFRQLTLLRHSMATHKFLYVV